jgi:hypothetical protein
VENLLDVLATYAWQPWLDPFSPKRHCGATAMTVCASNNAFRDLVLDNDDRRRGAHERADGASFLASHMVELHDKRVEKTAIHAGMCEQILLDEAPITAAVYF